MDLAVLRDGSARRVYYKMRVVDAITRRAGLVEPAEAQPEAGAARALYCSRRGPSSASACDRFCGLAPMKENASGRHNRLAPARPRPRRFFRLRQVRRVVAGAVELAHRHAWHRFASCSRHRCASCSVLQGCRSCEGAMQSALQTA